MLIMTKNSTVSYLIHLSNNLQITDVNSLICNFLTYSQNSLNNAMVFASFH